MHKKEFPIMAIKKPILGPEIIKMTHSALDNQRFVSLLQVRIGEGASIERAFKEIATRISECSERKDMELALS